ncbi:gephyrin-like molybdotransferase Glp [Cellulomonas sp. C5510]|uniref:molybdopterin molybdotransferase MoeA n=1 Tax=Cellulomonas sp. C5510 TaxID=2871170 RepID=UPI001C957543|nr:gephyrin-like molybdotransferase Glp [Cellulomonas sp. C5510]QZN84890.1 molybdopterin molybdotransferase MoeA [Cellulomonas sp. C5510]
MGIAADPALRAARTRSVEEHVAAVLAGALPTRVERVPLDDALGLVLGEDVASLVDLPGFDNSAMDGYAVRLADVAAVVPGGPVVLPVSDDVAAGDGRVVVLAPGTAVRIMTGAPVPAGTDVVVPFEDTDRGTATVAIGAVGPAGRHIRPRGEDVTTGATVLTAGTVVGPVQVGLLAACGHTHVPVHRAPRVVVLSTGSELIPAGRPLAPGQIHDSNRPMLVAAARALGALVTTAPAIPDVPGALAAAVREHLDGADVVITSAGVSAGAYDVVREDLVTLVDDPADVQLVHVAMQPGKPQGLAWVGERRVPVLGLPGNPVSAYVSFHLFARPLLRLLAGHATLSAPVVGARLTQAVSHKAGRRAYLRVRLTAGPDGWLATPVGANSSHLLGALAHADALLVVPEDVTHMEAGSSARVVVTEPDALEWRVP